MKIEKKLEIEKWRGYYNIIFLGKKQTFDYKKLIHISCKFHLKPEKMFIKQKKIMEEKNSMQFSDLYKFIELVDFLYLPNLYTDNLVLSS